MKELKGMKIELPEGYELKQEGETYKVVKKEFKLEEGKDYRHREMVGEIVIDRKGDNCNLGFLFGKFHDDMECRSPKLWIEATKEEVIEAFEEECVRVFGENWKDVEIEECMFHSNSEYLNAGIFVVNISKDIDGWRVWNKNGCIYFKGKWAKKKEVKYAEKLEDIERVYYISSSGEINRSISCQDVNNLPTEQLGEGVLALIQLLSFRQDIWDKGGKPEGDDSFGVFHCGGVEFSVTKFYEAYGGDIFRFKTREQAEYFKENHEGLIKEYYDKCGIK